MTNLAIGRMDLPDEQGWLALNGSTVMDGLVDSQYQFQPSDEQITQENVLLRLRGSAAQLRTWLDRLEQFQLQPGDLFSVFGATTTIVMGMLTSIKSASRPSPVTCLLMKEVPCSSN
ncbi:MAG: hypothetical protein GX773_02830 [Chloroflexi bacterium]|nr:hypothetical protein [Chloroflexota bacterium]